MVDDHRIVKFFVLISIIIIIIIHNNNNNNYFNSSCSLHISDHEDLYFFATDFGLDAKKTVPNKICRLQNSTIIINNIIIIIN